MKKRILSAALACVMAAALSIGAHAANSSETQQAEPQLNYIHTDIEENYIKSYGLYEQVMYGQIVFYTNISNGDITDEAVIIELPDELETIFERDGKEIEFTNNAEITELGSYSLTVIANGENILGGSANDRYYSLFRFRIMEAAEPDVDEGIDVGEWEDETEEAINTVPPMDITEPTEEASDQPTTDVTDELITVPDQIVEEPVESSEADDPWEDTDGSKPASTTAGGTESSGTADSGADPAEPTEAPKGDTSLIKTATDEDNIRLVTRAKTEIFTNIPPSMKTTGKVTFSTSADVQYKLFRNGVQVESYVMANEISEVGKYQLFIYDGSGTLPAEYDFEITERYVTGVTMYEVPNGCTVEQALYEGNLIRSEAASVNVGSEGTYSIDVKYGSYVFTETFVLDNTAPEFLLGGVEEGISHGGPVTIEFVSDDIESYELFFNGKPAEVKRLSITEPGEYIVRVYDHAGNMSEQSFTLEYKMNEMGILVIVLLGAIVVAGVVFFIRSKTKFIVR